MISADSAHVSIDVAVDPATAFAVFTEEIDTWWKRGRAYRTSDRSSILFEPGPEGRLVEVRSDKGSTREIGAVLVWEPAHRLVFEWKGVAFRGEEVTEVDVTFTRIEGGTQVALRHRGWDSLPADHPVRHGLEPADFIRLMGRFWAGLLVSAKACAERQSNHSQEQRQ